MDIIPVLDLARGVAVQAQAGDRARYEPVTSALVPERGRAMRSRCCGRSAPVLGATACYVADLDAIQGGAVQRTMLRELAQLETGFAGAILVDAGAHTRRAARFEVLSCGASQVVVGLETLRAFADLADDRPASWATTRVVFSLDLRLGSPILHPGDAGRRGRAARCR